VWRDRVAPTLESLDRRRATRVLLIGAAWLCAAAGAALVLGVSLQHRHLGQDLAPIYGAGLAARHGRPLYAVPNFVYTPVTALLAVPLTVVRFTVVSRLYLGLEVAVVTAVASVTVARFVPRRWWPVAAGLASAALLVSNLSVHSLWLENASLALTAAALVTVWTFGTDRWLAGCVVLVLSLLIKPLLLPLVLIPLLARRWRELAIAALGGAALLLGSLAVTRGGERLPDIARRLLRGSVLVHRASVDNLSLNGWAHTHGLPPGPILLVRIAVVAVAAWVCAVQVRSHAVLDIPRTAALASLLLLATFLAGTLSEIHYLFVVIPGGCAALLISRRTAVRAAAVVGIGATLVPLRNLSPTVHQGVLVLAELAFFTAVALALTDVTVG